MGDRGLTRVALRIRIAIGIGVDVRRLSYTTEGDLARDLGEVPPSVILVDRCIVLLLDVLPGEVPLIILLLLPLDEAPMQQASLGIVARLVAKAFDVGGIGFVAVLDLQAILIAILLGEGEPRGTEAVIGEDLCLLLAVALPGVLDMTC